MSPPPRSSSLAAVQSAAPVLAVRRREEHRREEEEEEEAEAESGPGEAAGEDPRREEGREDVSLRALMGDDLAWAARQEALSEGSRTLADELPSRVRGVAAYARASDGRRDG